jgi:hypothetical protein
VISNTELTISGDLRPRFLSVCLEAHFGRGAGARLSSILAKGTFVGDMREKCFDHQM